jgi:hypothetical protein
VIRHCSPQEILDKIEEFLENDAEKFVIKLWRALIFEQIKANDGNKSKDKI